MKRKIIEIDEDKCVGCGLCIDACAEGAIQLVNGKAKLVSETYCDGLGACIGDCPYGAISIVEREAEGFDKNAAEKRFAQEKKKAHLEIPCACPGMAVKSFEKSKMKSAVGAEIASELSQWPIQLHLLSPSAPYWNDADILLAADCTAFSFGAFHPEFLAGRKLIIACPKLDDKTGYQEKLTAIFKNNDIHSVTVLRMEVPCCAGTANLAKTAIEESGKNIPFQTLVIALNGTILK
jgi:Fe-S-cluster-containing hydrogenase component 2